MIRAALHSGAFFVLAGCADQAFSVYPHLTTVTLDVHLTSREEVIRICPPPLLAAGIEIAGCVSHIGRYDGDRIGVFLRRPETFNDIESCRAGHELWHALGAKH